MITVIDRDLRANEFSHGGIMLPNTLVGAQIVLAHCTTERVLNVAGSALAVATVASKAGLGDNTAGEVAVRLHLSRCACVAELLMPYHALTLTNVQVVLPGGEALALYPRVLVKVLGLGGWAVHLRVGLSVPAENVIVRVRI